jgi:hypothetical protein
MLRELVSAAIIVVKEILGVEKVELGVFSFVEERVVNELG